MPFHSLKGQLAEGIAAFLATPGITAEMLLPDMGTPPNLALGHVALPCFKLSKTLKAGSDKIAKRLCDEMKLPGVTVIATGPYANFRWDPSILYTEVLNAISSQTAMYGRDQSGAGKKVVLEYCSPNIAKKLGFQHIRSTLLGNTLANVYSGLGYELVRLNFVGDWGAQFAKLLAAVERWGDRSLLSGGDSSKAMDHLFEIYVRFHKELDPTPEGPALGSKALQKLESGDSDTRALWQSIKNVSIRCVDETLARMNIRFDLVEGESDYVEGIDKMLERVKKEANAKLSEGAWIVEVPGISTPALIQKKDGTTLYLTRDIAAAIDRWNRFKFDRMFYVVSEQQRLHFQLLFGVLKLMGNDWADRCEQLAFGTVLFGAEKMSTREGKVIFLDELLNEAKSRALAEITKKNPELADKESIAEMVGIGAVIFGNLSSHKKSDIEFDWERVISLEGETGPYVQYSSVRCESLLQKAREKGEWSGLSQESTPPGYEFAPEEEALILELGKFRSTLHLVARDNEPYLLTHYLIDVAKAFNRFYYKLPVLQAQAEDQRRLRLRLVAATRIVLENGLRYLGIDCPKEM